MREQKTILLTLCLAFVFVGCSQMVEVKTDYDDEANFETYKTFDWLHTDTSSMNLSDKWALADQYIREAITKEMKEKGITWDAASPDLIVAYTVGMKDKLGHVDFNVDYSVTQKNSEIYKTSGGVFVLDLVDAGSDHLVWRGEANAAMNVDPSPEIMQNNINNMMNKLFREYPPGAKPRR
ncbi:MAG: DUF4136 domain-containing protein [Candidatus Latescibacterota bacterium]|nr:MAG: DUF4136 domain-containing protein [Candidatus Latescibacterota bacterium]